MVMKMDIGLKDNARKTVAESLSGVLADSYTLYLKTQNYHWNVTGPNFPQLHELFGAQYGALVPAIDEIAERIRALGQPAPGSYSAYTKLAEVKEATGSPSANEMIRTLVADNETLVRRARAAKDLAEGAGDAESGDIMIARMKEHAKAAWMLRAMLE
jgi:starvation-inducible DNA-binding protein